MSTQNQPSLYDRLGGVYIATVVMTLSTESMVDPAPECEPAGR